MYTKQVKNGITNIWSEKAIKTQWFFGLSQDTIKKYNWKVMRWKIKKKGSLNALISKIKLACLTTTMARFNYPWKMFGKFNLEHFA